MVLILHIFVTHLTASTQRHTIPISNGGEFDGLSYGNLYKKSNKHLNHIYESTKVNIQFQSY